MATAAAVADTSEPAMESCWGIPTDRLMNVVVTETNGNCLFDSLCIPNVALAPGETTTVDISTYPSPANVGTLTFEGNSSNPSV